MANDIKGITVKIGGDTTDLKKALKTVDDDAKKVTKELKEVNRNLKYDPKNTELLAQKHELLGKQISDTKTRLQTLKEAQSQFSDEAKKTEEGQAQFRALTREILLTENQLKGLNKQFEETKKSTIFLDEVSKKLDKVSDIANKAGTSLTKNVTAPIIGLGTASVVAFGEVDKGSDTIAVKTGATGQAFTDMENSMKNIAQSIPTTFETAGEAVGEVNTRFGLTGSELENLSTKFVQFAELNNTSVTSSVDSVQKALSAFGLGSGSAGEMLDVLNRTAQNSGVSVDTLTSGLTRNATAFQQMGLSSNQSIAFMGQVEKSGLDLSTAMSGMDKATKIAAESNKSLGDVLLPLQEQIRSGKDDTLALQTTYDLFGKAGDDVFNAIKNGSLDFAGLASNADVLNDSIGNVSNTYEATLDPTDQFNVNMNRLKVLGADIATQIMPYITQAMEKLREVITKLSDKWKSLSDGQKETIIKLAGAVAVVGPVLIVFSKLVSGVSAVVKGFKLLGAGISAIKGAFAAGTIGAKILGGAIAAITSPIGIVVGVVAGLILTFTLLYTKCEWFRNGVHTVLEAIKNAFIVAFNAIKDFVGTVFNKIKEFWDTVLQPAFKAIGDFIQNTLAPIFSSVFDGIKSVVSDVFGAIVGFWNNILKPAFQAIWDFLSGTLATVFDTVFRGFKLIVSDVFNAISGFWNNILKPAFDGISSGASYLRDTMANVFDGIRSKVEDVFNGIKSFISPIVDWLKGIFNFEWKLPHIPLPHFSITGKFSLSPPEIPHLSVDWYAKAMNQAMVLDGATIFGQANGKLLGGGETGPEMIVGTDYLVDVLRQVTGGTNQDIDIHVNVYGADGTNIRQLADKVESIINHKLKRRQEV